MVTMRDNDLSMSLELLGEVRDFSHVRLHVRNRAERRY